jgi:hypothetical protein
MNILIYMKSMSWTMHLILVVGFCAVSGTFWRCCAGYEVDAVFDLLIEAHVEVAL